MIFLGTHQLRGGVHIFFYKVSSAGSNNKIRVELGSGYSSDPGDGPLHSASSNAII